jgi:DNA-binding MarR family transcriptional regulator
VPPRTTRSSKTRSSKEVRTRPQLLKALDEAARRIGAQSVLLSDLVAARVGLNSTDLECLDLLCLAGATTAGQLASHTGLTSGATTAAIDRLEQAGFVTRRRDAKDRRLVLVDVVETGVHLIMPFYEPLQDRCNKVNARYKDHQLTIVLRYLTDSIDATAEHVAWLQSQPPLSRHRSRHPMTAVTRRPRQAAAPARPDARLARRPRPRAARSRS